MLVTLTNGELLYWDAASPTVHVSHFFYVQLHVLYYSCQVGELHSITLTTDH